MPKAGDTVYLSLVVSGDNGAKYPRAILEDQNGNAIAASPVDLIHSSNGQYRGSFTMPNVAQVNTNYIVFSDAGHTLKDPGFDQDSEIFDLDTLNLEDIQNDISGFNSIDLIGDIGTLEFEGSLENIELNGEIEIQSLGC